MKNKGITIIALVITIVVLLILAGITISTINGENGIIKNSKEAKQQTEIANEKEVLEQATTEAIGKSKYGNLEEEKLKESLENKIGQGKSIIESNEEFFEVYFEESGRYYEIDKNGQIGEYQIVIKDEYPGDITKDRNGNVLNGNEEHPYEIWCIEDLIELSQNYTLYTKNYIVLCKNLNFKSKFSYSNSESKEYEDINQDGTTEKLIEEMQKGIGFTPINEFKSVFDGRNNKISNIYVNAVGEAGIFGNIYNGELKNLIIGGSIASKEGSAGGIVGKCYQSKISNCHNYAKVISEIQSAGGIVGTGANEIINSSNYGEIVANGTTRDSINYTMGCAGGIVGSQAAYIENCYNKGKIVSGYSAGGIIGYKYYTFKIVNCFNERSIEGKKYAGGVVGENIAGIDEIYNCYNKGEIKSDEYAGGILGNTYYTTQASIYNCCNMGTIQSNKNFGGIIGISYAGAGSYVDYMPKIVNNYSIPSSLKGIGNFTSSEVKQVDSISAEIIGVFNEYIETEDDVDKSNWRKWKITTDGNLQFE